MCSGIEESEPFNENLGLVKEGDRHACWLKKDMEKMTRMMISREEVQNDPLYSLE